jgi:hypothetical protein
VKSEKIREKIKRERERERESEERESKKIRTMMNIKRLQLD